MHFGYTVIEAEDGAQALEIYAQEGEKIDIVLLDLSMPRLSGRETLAQLLLMNPEAQVVMMSGYSSDMGKGSPVELGAKAFLAKPFNPEELARVLREVLKDTNRKSSMPAIER